MSTETLTAPISTWLPIFSGFYNSIFDPGENFDEYEYGHEEGWREHNPEFAAYGWEDIKEALHLYTDYRPGYLAAAQAITAAFMEWFNHETDLALIKSCQFETLNSPREYNFSTDSIDVALEIDHDVLRDYLAAHEAEWDGYLSEKYTSRSGFISSYPNDVEGWKEETENLTNLDDHYLGSILEFIARSEISDPEMSFYYAADSLSEEFMNAVEIDTAKALERLKKNAA